MNRKTFQKIISDEGMDVYFDIYAVVAVHSVKHDGRVHDGAVIVLSGGNEIEVSETAAEVMDMITEAASDDDFIRQFGVPKPKAKGGK